ncbi:MAG: peroxiredoxin [Candidatus Competibacteraceae bacterium]|nr:peroxiredoxin [Candidatus Competibacteraceae bacterium]
MNKAISKTLSLGDFAPDFVLKDQHNDLVRLSEVLKRASVVLYFYPKDDTPGCTTEAKCFRDNYELFLSLGAEVIGISSDSMASHIRFADKHKLPYTLLSDVTGKVRELYGVQKSWFVLPGRVTFVIDKQGVIRHIFSSRFQVARHIHESIEILKTI